MDLTGAFVYLRDARVAVVPLFYGNQTTNAALEASSLKGPLNCCFIIK